MSAARSRGGRGCVWVDDATIPGITRRRCGAGFRYLSPTGAPIRDARLLARIRSLAIPPAWERVWICPSARGHIQATGRDARGRKQYRYHSAFLARSDATKYARLVAFAASLPRLRAAVDEALAAPRFDRDKVLAAIVRLLELTLIRIGNEEYARQNHSYGLTTLRTRHVDLAGSTLHFHFRGKSGKLREVGIHDRRVARVVSRCSELPGEVLFQWLDPASGAVRPIESTEVNAWIRDRIGSRFSAKDIRTWAGTVLFGKALADEDARALEAAAARRRRLREAVKQVAEALGNTAAVCLRSYVHPVLPESWMSGAWPPARTPTDDAAPEGGLSSLELAVLKLLEASRRSRVDDDVKRARRSSARPSQGSRAPRRRSARGRRGSSGSPARPRPRGRREMHSPSSRP